MLVDKKLYLLRMEEDALEEKYCPNCGARMVKQGEEHD